MSTHPDFRRFLFPHGQFRSCVLLTMVRHRWFIRLRWVIVVAALTLLVLERYVTPTFRRPPAVLICVLTLAAVNLVWTPLGALLVREAGEGFLKPATVMKRVVAFANAQMIVDLLLLTIAIHYSGGIENPMVVFYVFHMLIAALLLRPVNALLQGGWALLLIAGLGVLECLGWLQPDYAFLPHSAMREGRMDAATVSATLAVLAAGIFGTLYFTLQISAKLDEQEHRLQETNRALEASQQAVRLLQERRARFMRTAAHQLKSPLAAIQTLAGLYRDGEVTPEAVRPTSERIIRRCREGIYQVSELLTLARVHDADPCRHGRASTNVCTVVQGLARRFGPLATEKNVAMNLVLPSDGAMLVRVDESDLIACIGNLMDNAIKYIGAAGVVSVEVSGDDQTVHVTVRDTGMGISAQTRESMFEAYRRGDEALAANIPGTGLGLAIVREVVEQCGGRIGVWSEPGRGSEFRVDFPRTMPPSAGTDV